MEWKVKRKSMKKFLTFNFLNLLNLMRSWAMWVFRFINSNCYKWLMMMMRCDAMRWWLPIRSRPSSRNDMKSGFSVSDYKLVCNLSCFDLKVLGLCHLDFIDTPSTIWNYLAAHCFPSANTADRHPDKTCEGVKVPHST